MKQIVTAIFVCILLQSGMEAMAQDTGLVRLSGENVQPGIRVYEYVREENGQQSSFGTIIENIEKDGDEMRIMYRQNLARMVVTDILVVDYEEFSPISYRTFVPAIEDIKVNYSDPEQVNVKILRRIPGAEQDTSYSAKLDRIRYDAHWLPTLVYALSKENKSTWNIPVYSYNNKEDIVGVKALGEEDLALHNQNYETFKYEISRRNSDDIYYYWIDKNNGRLVQTRGDINPDLILWLRIKEQI